jgi:ABC-2 type transport system permease protein
MRILFIQSRMEARLWLRRRETVIFTLMLPILFLLFFGALYGNASVLVSSAHTKYINYIVPAYSVYAIMAVCLGTISANLAGERQFGILKRLGGTPLSRPALIAAKIVSAAMLATTVIIVLVVVGIAGYHVELRGNQLGAIAVLAVGILSFASLGITLGGVVKPDSAVAAGSLLYLAFSFLGGVFVPLYQFPSGLRHIAQVLPSERMVHAMQSIWTYGDSFRTTEQDLIVMAVWGFGALLIAIRWFKWE